MQVFTCMSIYSWFWVVDLLRRVNRIDALEDYPVCQTNTKGVCARPAFKKAHADQLAHFENAD